MNNITNKLNNGNKQNLESIKPESESFIDAPFVPFDAEYIPYGKIIIAGLALTLAFLVGEEIYTKYNSHNKKINPQQSIMQPINNNYGGKK